ncbi:CapA family protein [Paenibacillus lutrae]|uniref:Capsule biosynthesis protein n=1 Tax=Paenibacillus lutrae TaxID=2078573 RepID=A0A7X3FF44_9BACL|nr:CapA family protein [Paenibacillus lutrae]MVO98484.1 capsule biosynthesis protein [Paenibacillus lutrae]
MKKREVRILLLSIISAVLLMTGLYYAKDRIFPSLSAEGVETAAPSPSVSPEDPVSASAEPRPTASPVPAASPSGPGSESAPDKKVPQTSAPAASTPKPKSTSKPETAAPKQIAPHEPIDLIFAGDALMDWSVKETIKKKGPDYPFQYVKQEVSKADYAFVNLETSVTNASEKDTNQLYNFKSDPVSLRGLKNAGFDLVSIANNHVLDFGRQGFLDTLDNLKQAGLPYVGGGRNSEEAYKAKTVKINGATVKYLAFSRFIPTPDWFAGPDKPGIAQAYDKSAVLPVIKREQKDCDYLFVYMHWGVEKNHKPEEWQRTFAKEMIDAGADGIIGSHVHVLQGFEYYKGKLIAYSIGNFLFPDYVKDAKADTGLLKLKLKNGLITADFNPYYIQKDQIIKRDAAYDQKQLSFLQSISYGVRLRGTAIEPAK